MAMLKGRFGSLKGAAARIVVRKLPARLARPKAVASLSRPWYLCGNQGANFWGAYRQHEPPPLHLYVSSAGSRAAKTAKAAANKHAEEDGVEARWQAVKPGASLARRLGKMRTDTFMNPENAIFR